MSYLQLHVITLENVNILQLITITILITPTLVLIIFQKFGLSRIFGSDEKQNTAYANGC